MFHNLLKKFTYRQTINSKISAHHKVNYIEER